MLCVYVIRYSQIQTTYRLLVGGERYVLVSGGNIWWPAVQLVQHLGHVQLH